MRYITYILVSALPCLIITLLPSCKKEPFFEQNNLLFGHVYNIYTGKPQEGVLIEVREDYTYRERSFLSGTQVYDGQRTIATVLSDNAGYFEIQYNNENIRKNNSGIFSQSISDYFTTPISYQHHNKYWFSDTIIGHPEHPAFKRSIEIEYYVRKKGFIYFEISNGTPVNVQDQLTSFYVLAPTNLMWEGNDTINLLEHYPNFTFTGNLDDKTLLQMTAGEEMVHYGYTVIQNGQTQSITDSIFVRNDTTLSISF